MTRNQRRNFDGNDVASPRSPGEARRVGPELLSVPRMKHVPRQGHQTALGARFLNQEGRRTTGLLNCRLGNAAIVRRRRYFYPFFRRKTSPLARTVVWQVSGDSRKVWAHNHFRKNEYALDDDGMGTGSRPVQWNRRPATAVISSLSANVL